MGLDFVSTAQVYVSEIDSYETCVFTLESSIISVCLYLFVVVVYLQEYVVVVYLEEYFVVCIFTNK
jgi:hypothetical protein